MQSTSYWQQITTVSKGTAQPGANASILSKLAIPIPPLNEQKRIVAKIEDLCDRHQRAKQALEAIPELCDRFRQSVLTAAFRGDLTADWREENPNLESASSLLEQIREKNERIGKKGEKNLTVSIAAEMNEISPIPQSWQWISFGELISSIRSGSTAVPRDEVSTYPILRSSSVRPGLVDLEDIRYLTKEQSENEDNFLNNEDLLFTRLSGSLDYVANCAVVRNIGNRRIQYPDRLFRAKLIDTQFLKYTELWFASPLLRNLITSNAKSSAGHQRISMGAITEAPIPIPPLAEQKQIVEIVCSFFNLIAHIQQRYEAIQANLKCLDQSILAKAFRGELVEQDPKDEPASILLERIRAEREKADNNKKTKGKRAKQLKLEV